MAFIQCFLNALHIQQYYNDLYNSGRKGKTVRCYHAFLHSAFKYAVKIDLLPGNPTEKTELPRKEKREATYYTKEELEKLFEAFKGDRMELVVHIAAYYGLRRGEILGLNWDSIDFDNKTLTVRRKITSSFKNGMGERIHIDYELKTELSIRTFPLIPHINEMLKERMQLENYYSKLLGDDFDRTYDGFICRDNTGKLITPYYASNHFHDMLIKHGLKHIRFHDLRYSCASLMVAKGVPMKAVQEWLGHSTFSTTIPVPNSNTKLKQYLPTIILISKGRFSCLYARHLPIILSKALSNLRLLSSLSSCPVSRHTVLRVMSAGM